MPQRLTSSLPSGSSGLRAYLSVLRLSTVRRPAAGAALASLPIGMLGLAVLLLVQRSSPGFAAAGLVVGLLSLGTGVGMAVQGRLIDRWGQPRVLLSAASVQLIALSALVFAAHAGAEAWLLGLLALFAGAGEPQVGASLRALWTDLVPDNERQVATALSSMLFEGPVVLGPLLLVALLLFMSPAGVVLVCAVCFAVGTLVLIGSTASRSWRSTTRRSSTFGALASAGIRTTTAIAATQGLLTGLLQVPAAAAASNHGTPSAAGLLYAALSAGSLIGTVIYGARRWSGLPAHRLSALLIATTAAVAGCALASSLLTLALALFAVGACLGPVAVTYFGLVDELAPPGTVVEAFTTTTAAALAAFAGGAAAAGILVDHVGTSGAFLTGAAAAGASSALVALRRRTLAQPTPTTQMPGSDTGDIVR